MSLFAVRFYVVVLYCDELELSNVRSQLEWVTPSRRVRRYGLETWLNPKCKERMERRTGVVDDGVARAPCCLWVSQDEAVARL